ncbi:serine hydrolase domain-containing protein [Azospirillum halopraeferens]|uniref:serine hydrolase domain-containing protein n=1 Tax=Azospirillum halopraeferens TaxID=34010 RepID=UPI0004910954|nr:serine hydrolase domain-containing protein [Azospirillum halopraeferens]
MRTLIAAAVLAGITTAAVADITAAAADSGLDARLDAVIDRAIAENRIVGTVVLVARDGRVVYRRAAGLADREAGRPMAEDAVFPLASVSKPIVSAAALRLAEAGTLSVDDPVSRWLPDFRPRTPDGAQPEITIHHLLTHTAGLTYGFLEPADSPFHALGVSDGLDRPGIDLAENLRRLALAPLAFVPGTAWRYSLATDVLGAVLEQAAGADLPQVVRDTVTGPLGMTDSGFTAADPARLVTPYADGDPAPVRMQDGTVVPFGAGGARFAPSRALDPAAYPSGGAGMVGTAGDVLTFLEAIRTGGGPILTPATVERMRADRLGGTLAGPAPGWGFGYGWAVLVDPAPTGTPQAAGTIAWGGAYGHSWFVDPANRLSVVALTNTAFAGMAGAFPDGVRDAVYGAAAP